MTFCCLLFVLLAAVAKSIPICDFIASSNIGVVSSSWKCDANEPLVSVCSWAGIHCKDNTIASIDVSGLKVSGISLSFILIALHDITNTYNKIGTLPNSIGDIHTLSYLDLEGSSYYGLNVYMRILTLLTITYVIGQIPSSICNLKELTYINLIGNSFECYPNCLSNYFHTHINDFNALYECKYDTLNDSSFLLGNCYFVDYTCLPLILCYVIYRGD